MARFAGKSSGKTLKSSVGMSLGVMNPVLNQRCSYHLALVDVLWAHRSVSALYSLMCILFWFSCYLGILTPLSIDKTVANKGIKYNFCR